MLGQVRVGLLRRLREGDVVDVRTLAAPFGVERLGRELQFGLTAAVIPMRNTFLNPPESALSAT